MTAHFRCLHAVSRARLLHGASAACALSRAHVSSSVRFFAQLRRIAFSFPPRAFRTRNSCCRIFPPSSPPWRARLRAFGQTALARWQLQHCLNRRNGAAQKSPVCWSSQQTSLLGNSCSFDSGRRPVGTHRLSRAPGPPGDQADDRLGSVWKRGLTLRRKGPPCAADSLTTC